MNTCDTCKWWTPLPNGKKYDVAECNNPKLNNSGPPVSDELYSVNDGVGPITGPKFGCIHWESK